MTITQTLTATDQLQPVSAQTLQQVQQVLRQSLNLQPNDQVLIVTDAALLQPEANWWFEGCKSITPTVTMVVLDGLTRSGQEPPAELIAQGQTVDVLILQTSYSLTHTTLSSKARLRGARVASLPGVSFEIMQRTLNQDYTPVKILGDRLQTRLTQGTTLKITSPAGTNLTTTIRTNAVINDSGLIPAGEIGNLPAGEVFFAPIEETTNGVWVVNGSIADDTLGDEVIIVTIKNGVATQFEGGAAADRLAAKLDATGHGGRVVAEVGIGTNRTANPRATLIEAEKAYGTAHLAFGNNAGFGGQNQVPIHLDGVTLEPTITIDTKTVILEKGTFYV